MTDDKDKIPSSNKFQNFPRSLMNDDTQNDLFLSSNKVAMEETKFLQRQARELEAFRTKATTLRNVAMVAQVRDCLWDDNSAQLQRGSVHRSMPRPRRLHAH
jgi:hypothetical protein